MMKISKKLNAGALLLRSIFYLVNPGGLFCPPCPPKPGGRLLPPPKPGGREPPNPGGETEGGRTGGGVMGRGGGGGNGRTTPL